MIRLNLPAIEPDEVNLDKVVGVQAHHKSGVLKVFTNIGRRESGVDVKVSVVLLVEPSRVEAPRICDTRTRRDL